MARHVGPSSCLVGGPTAMPARPNRRTFFCMSAGQAVLLVGGSLVILAVMIAVMIRLDRARRRRRIQGRREAWNAAGSVGPAQAPATTVPPASTVAAAPSLAADAGPTSSPTTGAAE